MAHAARPSGRKRRLTLPKVTSSCSTSCNSSSSTWRRRSHPGVVRRNYSALASHLLATRSMVASISRLRSRILTNRLGEAIARSNARFLTCRRSTASVIASSRP